MVDSIMCGEPLALKHSIQLAEIEKKLAKLLKRVEAIERAEKTR